MGGDEGTERGQERGEKKTKLDGTGRTEHGKTGRRRDKTDTEDAARDGQDEETDRKDKRGQKTDEDHTV